MNATIVDWEDTLAVKKLADEAGIELSQAIAFLAALSELPARQVIRIVGTASKRRRNGR